jgi:hypothetical protein
MELTKLNNTMINKINHYRKASATHLYDVYTTWSDEKYEAYKHCRELYLKYKGENFRIISANRYAFSVAFVGIYNGSRAFFLITKNADKVCYF